MQRKGQFTEMRFDGFTGLIIGGLIIYFNVYQRIEMADHRVPLTSTAENPVAQMSGGGRVTIRPV